MPKNPDKFDKILPITDEMKKTIIFLMEVDYLTLSSPHPQTLATPLHNICEHNPPIDLVERMFKLAPMLDLAQKKDVQEYLPLHVAVEYHANQKVVQKLIEMYPEGVKKGQDIECLPIHIAAECGSTFRVLRHLLRAYPEGIGRVDADLETPLHIVFDADKYSKNWTCDGKGRSLKAHLLHVKDMVHFMLKIFFTDQRQKKGVAWANKAVVRLLRDTENYENMSVIDHVERCHEKCELPRALYEYLIHLAEGRRTVDLSHSFSTGCESPEKQTKRRGGAGHKGPKARTADSAPEGRKRKIGSIGREIARAPSEEDEEFEFDLEADCQALLGLDTS